MKKKNIIFLATNIGIESLPWLYSHLWLCIDSMQFPPSNANAINVLFFYIDFVHTIYLFNTLRDVLSMLRAQWTIANIEGQLLSNYYAVNAAANSYVILFDCFALESNTNSMILLRFCYATWMLACRPFIHVRNDKQKMFLTQYFIPLCYIIWFILFEIENNWYCYFVYWGREKYIKYIGKHFIK